jgi:hypothetical protein
MECHELALDEKETHEIIKDYFRNITVKNQGA